MTDPAPPWHQLRLHPQCRDAVVEGQSRGCIRGVEARAGWRRDGQIDLTWRVTGAIGALLLAPKGPRERRGELWRSTCFEAFIAPRHGADASSGSYTEINVAPSGAWAVYAFKGYRRGGGDIASADALHVATDVSAAQLEVHAVMGGLPILAKGAAQLALGLSAVLEDSDGHLSYWALAHGPGAPDFHHSSAFSATVLRDAEDAIWN